MGTAAHSALAEDWNASMNAVLAATYGYQKLSSVDRQTALGSINWMATVIDDALAYKKNLPYTHQNLANALLSSPFWTSRFAPQDLEVLLRGLAVGMDAANVFQGCMSGDKRGWNCWSHGWCKGGPGIVPVCIGAIPVVTNFLGAMNGLVWQAAAAAAAARGAVVPMVRAPERRRVPFVRAAPVPTYVKQYRRGP